METAVLELFELSWWKLLILALLSLLAAIGALVLTHKLLLIIYHLQEEAQKSNKRIEFAGFWISILAFACSLVSLVVSFIALGGR